MPGVVRAYRCSTIGVDFVVGVPWRGTTYMRHDDLPRPPRRELWVYLGVCAVRCGTVLSYVPERWAAARDVTRDAAIITPRMSSASIDSWRAPGGMLWRSALVMGGRLCDALPIAAGSPLRDSALVPVRRLPCVLYGEHMHTCT